MGRFLRCACSVSVLDCLASCARFDYLRLFATSLSKKKKYFSDFCSRLSAHFIRSFFASLNLVMK